MTAVAGGIVASADVTALAALTTAKPLVRLIQQAAQSIANTPATVALTFGSGSEDIDTHAFHDVSTNTSRVTPTIAGYYRCTATYAVAANTATQLLVVLGKNGALVQPLVRHTPAATSAAKSVTTTAILSANGSTDYFEMLVQQNSGGALNTQVGGSVNSVFEVEFLRSL